MWALKGYHFTYNIFIWILSAENLMMHFERHYWHSALLVAESHNCLKNSFSGVEVAKMGWKYRMMELILLMNNNCWKRGKLFFFESFLKRANNGAMKRLSSMEIEKMNSMCLVFFLEMYRIYLQSYVKDELWQIKTEWKMVTMLIGSDINERKRI